MPSQFVNLDIVFILGIINFFFSSVQCRGGSCEKSTKRSSLRWVDEEQTESHTPTKCAGCHNTRAHPGRSWQVDFWDRYKAEFILAILISTCLSAPIFSSSSYSPSPPIKAGAAVSQNFPSPHPQIFPGFAKRRMKKTARNAR